MDRLRDIGYMTDILHRLGESGLLIDPRLQGMREELFDTGILEIFDKETVRMLDSHWHIRDEHEWKSNLLFGVVPFTELMAINCIYNFFLGTAIYVSHDLKGRVDIDEEIAEMAVNDVKSFSNNNGFINLCLCYLVIVGFESHQALAHYGHMTEKEFISGEKHRPGASDSLEVELFIGLSAGFYERVEINGESCIRLTDAGRKRMKESLQMLTDSKYMQFRMQVMYVSQFDQLDDFEPIQDRLFPEAMRIRRGFLDFLNLKPGMEILELGCGSGSFTIDSGLADAVGEQGWVTATDPSAGMLQQAQAKIDRLAYKNISLEAVAAEQIPYGDQEFDGVVGVSFFHFTDNDLALKEMIRAARPGGVVGLQGPLSFNFDKPFFREWFEEFFLQAQHTGSKQPHHYLPKEGEIGNLLKKKGLRNVQEQTATMPYVFSDPQSVIKFLVYGVGFFQKELIFMPLAARQALTDRLIEKGKDICARYSIEERTIPLPTYYAKGTV